MDAGVAAIVTLVLVIGAAGVMAWYRDLVWPELAGGRPGVNRSATRGLERRAAGAAARAPAGRRRSPRPRSRRSNAGAPRSAQQNAESASVQRSAPSAERSPDENSTPADDVITITPKELTQLAEAIRFHAAGQSKQSAIEAAFQCSKGAGATWRRASALFDQAAGKGGQDGR